ncbi:MAG: PKD domain-containing protein, partial [Actinobacteria bacterium]|nr:PKD domain-containing protein [Actinomycetota bacterium]
MPFVLAGRAGAATPASATTSSGQNVNVDIASPTLGARIASPTVSVSGTAGVSAFTPSPISVLYVTDVSGSTDSPNGLNCNGDGGVSGSVNVRGGDNLNGDDRVGDTLDCEIAATVALNASFPAGRNIDVGVVALGGSESLQAGTPNDAQTADMTSAAGDTPFVPYTGTADLTTVETNLQRGHIIQYTPKTVGRNTNYEAALNRIATTMTAQAGRQHLAYFASDGVPTVGNITFTAALNAVVASQTKVNTYGVGAAAGDCGVGQPLRRIADATGGTCTEVTNPAALSAAVTQPVTLNRVEVKVGAGAPVSVEPDASGNWSVAGLVLPRGTQTIAATAVASDGTRATAAVDVVGTTAPTVTTSDVTVAEGSDVTLSATVSDPDGGPFTYSWSPTTNLSDPTSPSPTVHALDNGVTDYTVTVTDPDGLTGKAEARVTVLNVTPSLGAITLGAVPQTGQPLPITVTFTDLVLTTWSGAPVSDPGSLTPNYHGVDDADVVLTLTAQDSHGLTASDTATVHVSNVAPTVTSFSLAGQATTGDTVGLTATFADPGTADTHTASIDWGDGTSTPASVDEGAHTVTGSHAYASGGTFTVTLTVRDDDGGAGQASGTIVVNTPPTADAGPDLSVPEGTTVTIHATAADADSDALTYEWSPAGAVSNPNVLNPTFSGIDDGSTTLTLVVSDTDGATATDSVTITTTNVAPAAGPPSISGHLPGQPVALTATFSDPGMFDTHTATVDWGDGSVPAPAAVDQIGHTVSASHPYASTGTYHVAVTVTDDDGGSGSSSTDVVVARPTTLTYNGAPSGNFS